MNIIINDYNNDELICFNILKGYLTEWKKLKYPSVKVKKEKKKS